MIRDPSWPPCFHLWYVLDCVAGVRRGGRQEGEGKRKRKRERGMRFSPPSLSRSLPFLCPHVFIRVCIRLRSKRQKERERRESGRGRGREKGRGECAFLPLPSPAPSPFCAPMFSSEYVLDCVAGVGRRGRGGGEKRERGRGREKGRAECAFLPLPLPRSLPSLCLPRRLDMYLWNDCQNPGILPSHFQ